MHSQKLYFTLLLVLTTFSSSHAEPSHLDKVFGQMMSCIHPLLCKLGLKEELKEIFLNFDKKTTTFVTQKWKALFPNYTYDFETGDMYTDEFWDEKVTEVLCERFQKREDRDHFYKQIGAPTAKYLGDVCLNIMKRDECITMQDATTQYQELALKNQRDCDDTAALIS